MKKKIPVSADQTPLQNPFAALDLTGLPEGPHPPAVPGFPETAAAGSKGATLAGESPVLRLEKAGRGGKSVIVVSAFSEALCEADLDSLLASLRKSLGLGGTRRGREIELNTSEPARVRAALERLGARPRGVA